MTIQQILRNRSSLKLKDANSVLLTELQIELKLRGYNPGLIDGEYGQNTAKAWSEFKTKAYLDDPELVGAGSLRKLLSSKIVLDFEYQSKYIDLWNGAKIKDSVLSEVDLVINTKFVPHKSQYQAVQKKLGVPWYVVAVIHYRESDCDFNSHLFNGDPLSGRTVNEPRGMPLEPEPPYQWFQGAIAALEYDGLHHVQNWGIPNTLYTLEKYNGLGYWTRGVNSPYLWSGSNQYTSGKYTSDGHYDSQAVDEQLGGFVLLKRMIDKELL